MDLFLRDIEDVNNKNRQYAQKRKIVALLNKSEKPLTIPGICKKVRLSIPTGTKLINELIDDGVIVESGKKETDNGRRPSLYQTDSNYAYSLGLVILLKGISFSVFNMGMTEVYSAEDESFILENTTDCLNKVIGFIKKSTEDSGIDKNRLLGLGIGITGRVNSLTGNSFNYFNFLEKSLAGHLSKSLGFPVFIDNDTHVLGLAEQVLGEARNVENAFVVNLSRGLGMAIIANSKLVGGEQGFAGEFGHIQFAESDKLCLCGKRGCLGTEVSGHALEQNFLEQIKSGKTSLLINSKDIDSIRYEDIIQAAWEGDALSISLIHNMGFLIGKALGNMINLLNPKTIIIGGKFSMVKDILTDSIKLGMTHTALSLPLRSCELTFSSIGVDAGIKGAGVMVLKQLEII